jgi:hypothetical protein
MTSFAPPLSENTTKSESEYRSISPWAVASLILGVLSVTVALHRFFIFIPLAGAVLGWKALRQLRQSGEVQSGIALARIGIATSVFFGLSGVIFLRFVMCDVPSGYKEITFDDLKPNAGELVSRYAVELQPTMRDDQRVFIKGFIYPGRKTQGIKEFMLVPTLGHCSFCFTQLRPTDFVRVKLVSDLTVDYKSTEIGVGGRFRVDQFSGESPYALEADHVQ